MRRLLKRFAVTLTGLAMLGAATLPAYGQTGARSDRPPASITGHAVVKSGSLIWIDNNFITLHEIEAPGYGQQCAGSFGVVACGNASLDALTKFIEGKPLTCTIQSDYDYICRRQHDQQDVAWFMVYFGFAKAPGASRYRRDMVIAATGRHGLWGAGLYDWQL